MKGRWEWLVAVTFGALIAFLGVNYHSHSPRFTYHSELWADAAGYHVYLPLLFDRSELGGSFPDSLETRTGAGFKIDLDSGRVITKYTYGVALLRAPFYLLGKLFRSSEEPDPGFSLIDHAMVDISSAFYLALAFLILHRYIRKHHQVGHWSMLAMFTLLTGGNLLYYAVAAPGMSHVYSFFLFACLLFVASMPERREPTTRWSILIGGLIGVITVTRPTNVFVVLLIPLVTAREPSEVLVNIKSLFRPVTLFVILLTTILVWIPQFVYWKYAYQSWFTWPYAGESFTNWRSPELLRYWFAFKNGAVPYSPMLVLAGIALWSVRKESPIYASGVTIVIILVSYLNSSWWLWHFGCGFGCRTLVEYQALFLLPLAAWMERTSTPSRRWLTIVTTILCSVWSTKLMYTYDGCWLAEDWDLSAFLTLLTSPPK